MPRLCGRCGTILLDENGEPDLRRYFCNAKENPECKKADKAERVAQKRAKEKKRKPAAPPKFACLNCTHHLEREWITLPHPQTGALVRIGVVTPRAALQLAALARASETPASSACGAGPHAGREKKIGAACARKCSRAAGVIHASSSSKTGSKSLPARGRSAKSVRRGGTQRKAKR